MYLLFMDTRSKVRMPRLRRPKLHVRADAVLSVYLGLAASVFLSTLIPAWTLSSRQYLKYEVVAQKPSNVTQVGLFLQGQPYHESVVIQNPSPLPLVVIFRTGDPNVTYDPPYAVVPIHSKRTFELTVQTPALGERTAQLQMGVYLPLLPPFILAALCRVSLALAALATSLVPVAIIAVIALMDPRSQMALGRLRTKLIARFS
jgi:hypothetical protein